MATPEAQALYTLRKQLVEPSFGILKEQVGARRLLLRGLANVRAEFVMLATAFQSILPPLLVVYAFSLHLGTVQGDFYETAGVLNVSEGVTAMSV